MLGPAITTTALLYGAAAAATTSYNTTRMSSSPCQALSEAGLQNRLIVPSDGQIYTSEVNSYFSANERQNASCFVLPETTEEVSLVLTTLVKAKAAASANVTGWDWEVAVRSGGHSSTGASSTNNGVTIDLKKLNGTSYNPETNIAGIGPGGRWQYVYQELLEKYGPITVAGGRDGDVGVGGFLLGGGNSYYSGNVGFGCDTVANFEVVLADGSVVDANASNDNADLYRALKGGGSNFGIVTRYDMTAIPAPDIFTDTRLLSSNYSTALIDAVVGYADSGLDLADDALFVFWAHDTSVTGTVAAPNTIYGAGVHVNTQGVTNSSTPWDEVVKLPALYNVTTVEDVATAAFASQVQNGTWNYGTTLMFNNDPRIARKSVELHNRFVASLNELMGPSDFFTQLFLQPFPSYRWGYGAKGGGNVLGLDNLTNNALLYTAGVGLMSEDGPRDQANALMITMRQELEDYAKEVGGSMEFVYMNYAGADQIPISTYGKENIELIRDVAKRYDPTGVFQTLIPGGFKISQVV
ncbi:FAD-binding domain-containing protein [Xylariaceae sp. FL0255]|nr:FAD-binding domain-containing protein [Xylariaceae sp. FL0255]